MQCRTGLRVWFREKYELLSAIGQFRLIMVVSDNDRSSVKGDAGTSIRQCPQRWRDPTLIQFDKPKTALVRSFQQDSFRLVQRLPAEHR